MVGWSLNKLHILESNINKGRLVTGRGTGPRKVDSVSTLLESGNSKLVGKKNLLMLFFVVLRILVGFTSSWFEHCLSERVFCWKMCYIVPPWVSVNQDAVQTISS